MRQLNDTEKFTSQILYERHQVSVLSAIGSQNFLQPVMLEVNFFNQRGMQLKHFLDAFHVLLLTRSTAQKNKLCKIISL